MAGAMLPFDAAQLRSELVRAWGASGLSGAALSRRLGKHRSCADGVRPGEVMPPIDVAARWFAECGYRLSLYVGDTDAPTAPADLTPAQRA